MRTSKSSFVLAHLLKDCIAFYLLVFANGSLDK